MLAWICLNGDLIILGEVSIQKVDTYGAKFSVNMLTQKDLTFTIFNYF